MGIAMTEMCIQDILNPAESGDYYWRTQQKHVLYITDYLLQLMQLYYQKALIG